MRKKNTIPLFISLAAFVFSLAFWSACTSREKAAEEMIEKATGGQVDVDLQGRTMKVKTKEGDISWGEAEAWPADIPGDVPRFTLGKVTGVVRSHSADIKHWTIIFSDVEEGGLARYAEVLKADGWEILASFQMPEGESLAAQKGGMTLNLGSNATEKALTVQVGIETK
ncbi:MAG: hypothetical protein JW747_07640 [Candidatus Aminicenantes bacterium]|nr:hypothetical protein [Candidatus Aminicenantes bacterium]